MAPTLDGSVGVGGLVGNPVTVTLVTTKPGNIIYLFSVTGNVGSNISSITSTSGLTWQNRIAPFSSPVGAVQLETWWAYAPNILSSEVITITYSGGAATPRIAAFGINGPASTTAPFEPNASFPAKDPVIAATTASNIVSTNNANVFLIGMLRGETALGTISEPSGFTLITTTGSTAQDVSYKILSSLLSSQTFTYNWVTPGNADFLLDAVFGPYMLSVSEAGNAIDTQSQILTYPETVIEKGSALDINSQSLTLPETLTEKGAAIDAQSQVMTAPVSTSEAGSAVDVNSQTMTAPVSVSENGNALDTESQVMTAPVINNESGNAQDINSQAMTANVSVVETGKLLDGQNQVTTIQVTLSERGSAQDNISEIITIAANVNESGSAADAISQNSIFSISIVERGAAADLVEASNKFLMTVSEAGLAADGISEILNISLSLSESGSAQDIAMIMRIAPFIVEYVLRGYVAPNISISGQAAPSLDVQGYPKNFLNLTAVIG